MPTQPSDSPTFRKSSDIPRMPTERELDRLPCLKMDYAGIEPDGHLRFSADGTMRSACKKGFFFLEIPRGLDLSPVDAFVREFYKDDDPSMPSFRRLGRLGDYEGYTDRPFDQWETLYLEERNWHFLPSAVAEVGKELADLGVAVLRAILIDIGIPIECWDSVTGGLSSGAGHRMLAFNHYRSDKATRGCKMHRDSGWVTLVRADQPGLVTLYDGAYQRIDPRPDCFIVNFGSSIEVLTQQSPDIVRANIHGVVQTLPRLGNGERHSYVMFLDSGLDKMIYRMTPEGPEILQSVQEFAAQEVARTYDEHDVIL